MRLDVRLKGVSSL